MSRIPVTGSESMKRTFQEAYSSGQSPRHSDIACGSDTYESIINVDIDYDGGRKNTYSSLCSLLARSIRCFLFRYNELQGLGNVDKSSHSYVSHYLITQKIFLKILQIIKQLDINRVIKSKDDEELLNSALNNFDHFDLPYINNRDHVEKIIRMSKEICYHFNIQFGSSSINYYEKYLKYKFKYSNLKKIENKFSSGPHI